ncbi:hypothetical protein HK104_009072 [Borealophlyctis nickersoniae]|nr:hypothetical protein HK104_009072 [Borealophlyctis nickersoniae]
MSAPRLPSGSTQNNPIPQPTPTAEPEHGQTMSVTLAVFFSTILGDPSPEGIPASDLQDLENFLLGRYFTSTPTKKICLHEERVVENGVEARMVTCVELHYAESKWKKVVKKFVKKSGWARVDEVVGR